LTAPKFKTDAEYEEFVADCRRYPDETERYRALDEMFDELDGTAGQRTVK